MNRLAKLPLAQLELYTLLVYYGIKDAFLVDCCSMNSDEASSFAHYLQEKYTLAKETLITVLLDCDILFVNREVLRRKISNLEQKQNIPVVIDVNSTLSVLLVPSAQMECIYNVFKDIGSTDSALEQFEVPVTESLRATVGLPFVAGWLLGYPCLYRAQESPASSGVAEDCTIINLIKYTISADVSIKGVSVGKKKGKNEPNPKRNANASTSSDRVIRSVEVMGFSIPERLLELNANIETQLQGSVDGILLDVQHRANVLGSADCLQVRYCNVTRTVHTVPKLAL